MSSRDINSYIPEELGYDVLTVTQSHCCHCALHGATRVTQQVVTQPRRRQLDSYPEQPVSSGRKNVDYSVKQKGAFQGSGCSSGGRTLAEHE